MLQSSEVRSLRTQLNKEKSELPRIFQALADQSRWKIFQLLLEHQDICVTEIANVLDISTPAASQQLKIMETSGLIKRERDGQRICYRIRDDSSTIRSVIRLTKTS